MKPFQWMLVPLLVVATLSCRRPQGALLLRPSAASIEAVRHQLDAEAHDSGVASFFVAHRAELGRGLVVDEVRDNFPVIDAQSVFFVASGPQMAPRLLSAVGDFRDIVSSWWPESGDELVRFCALAAQVEHGWERAEPVWRRAVVSRDVLIADMEQLSRLHAPQFGVLSGHKAEVDLWIVRTRGASRARCSLTHGRRGGQVALQVSDSLLGLGFLR